MSLLSSKQQSDIKKILNSYKLPTTIDTLSLTQALRRVDIIPKELALCKQLMSQHGVRHALPYWLKLFRPVVL